MNKHLAQVNVRLSEPEKQALSKLRRLREPIPSASDVMREALMEKFQREVKPNGHGGRAGKKERG